MAQKFDLEERTAKFGEQTIKFCQSLSPNLLSNSLIHQLIRSTTSVGANYMEANGTDTKKDFHSKIGICKKEAKESQHWLRMLLVLFPQNEKAIQSLWNEARELSLIFGAINRNR